MTETTKCTIITEINIPKQTNYFWLTSNSTTEDVQEEEGEVRRRRV